MAPKRQAVSKPRHPTKHPREPDVPALPWEMRDDAMLRRYNRLSQRVVICTRYVDTESLIHLGITDTVASWAQNIGWSFFLSMHPPTLLELTLEFLSSLECDDKMIDDSEAPSIRFRLLGEEFTLSIRRFNNIFEFPNVGDHSIPVSFYAQTAWNALAFSSIYNPSSSKATRLKHPAAKYMHRFMAHSIFGRGESTGVVSKRELYILWAMCQEGRVQINSGYWMINHLLNVARHDSGAIVIGGLVSMIALRLGKSLDAPIHTRVLGNDRLDLHTLVLMKMCRREGGRYVVINEGGDYQPRPPVAVQEDIPTAAQDASTSHHTPPHTTVPSTADAENSSSVLEQVLQALNSLTAEVREVRAAQSSMHLKLASIETQLQSLNETMNATSDEDRSGAES